MISLIAIKKYIKNPTLVFVKLANIGLFNWIGDEKFLKMEYWCVFHKRLNLLNPITFNEKIQWLKINDRNTLYTRIVDKYEVKSYISGVLGDGYTIPTLGIWKDADEIDFDVLPNQFVLKCTHDSGGVIVVKDKSAISIKKIKVILNSRLKKNYFYHGREWPYKNVIPRIIAEEYVEDSESGSLRDYKFFCFNGQVKALFVATDRPYATKFDFFDENFRRLNIKQHYPNSTYVIDKPSNFEKMIKIAKVLSAPFKEIRIDMYCVDGKIYVGEMTFYHFSGFEKFEPESIDYEWGKYIDI